MPRAVASNPFLLDKITELRTELDADATLRLFKNDLTPTPATALAAFTEADFAGYAEVDMAGEWGAPFQVAAGHYTFLSNTIRFDCTAGNQVIYGWYLISAGGLIVSRRFDAPYTVAPDNPLLLVLKPSDWSRSLFA